MSTESRSGISQEKIIMKSALLFAGLLASSAFAAPGNALTGVSVAPSTNGVEVTVRCSQPPVFNVFRLKEPDRLVVDVSGASIDAIKGHHEGAGPITGIVASQFSDAKAEVGRLLLGLSNARRYDVKAVDNALIISIEGEPRQDTPVAAAPKPEAQPATAEPVKSSVPGETIIASRVDEKPVKKPATRLKGITASSEGLKLVTDGEVAKFEVIELADPARLAIDLFGLKGSPRAPRTGLANVRDVRVGAHEEKVRVVIEFAQRPSFDVRRRADGVAIGIKGVSKEVAQAPAAPAEGVEAEIDGAPVALENSVSVAPDARVDITDVSFKESSNGGVVQLKLKGNPKWTVDRPDGKSAVLNLEGAHIARQLERSLDTSALETPVKMVSVFAVPGSSNRVRVVVAGGQALDQLVNERPGVMQWRFSTKGGSEQIVSQDRSAGFSTEADEVTEEGAPQQRRNYVGKRVSFEFKDIDIHNLLRIIAEISKKNIVVADDVGGKITVRLRNVPWDQALDLVLRSKSLGKEEFGNIIRVAPLATLETEAKARAERRENLQKSTPLSVSLISVNYATASDMSARVKEVLSARGNVAVDARTNTLIVRDLPENMGKVRSLVASLDLQTPQVLIESRIVEASTTFRREVGIQWGGQGLMSGVNGNPTGLVFPSSVAVTGGAVEGGSLGNPAVSNYAVSLPVGAGAGSGGALGLAFGSAGGAVALNLRLSALEAQGAVKTISAPKVTTLDNATARISQGVSIPFSQVSAAGANTQFFEARLSLEVTPHITQDASVLMNIRAENNQPDPGVRGSNGQPGIARKEAATNVLVKDGETTVIGGIYVRGGANSQSGLPILSKIPVLGFFFRNSTELETKNELLIFVTPRILNRNAVAQNP
ncbi:MAG: type IV pilus secretin PilQ [Archangium sp.]|nr:type IV pilus secretin PilQ [Archangium sp.]MDP3156179.1 type IV pilus secretin PilQ [Archangium sp.]MDP3571516.1 type IV pilus secretin PilQ [Archangium sp.]